MILKSILVALMIFTSSSALFTQESINNYKYILIPEKFDVLKSENQFRINELAKFLFNKYGYTAFLTNDDLPEDLKQDRCLALTANAKKVKGGFLKTKLHIILSDCFDKEILVSQVGESREKQYDTAYNKAFRDAFKTFQFIEYNYTPINKDKPNVISEITKTVVPKNNKTKMPPKAKSATYKANSNIEILYAQKTKNGYQVVDATPKVVLQLLDSNLENVYIVKNENAIVYLKDGAWYYSGYQTDEYITKGINLKF